MDARQEFLWWWEQTPCTVTVPVGGTAGDHALSCRRSESHCCPPWLNGPGVSTVDLPCLFLAAEVTCWGTVLVVTSAGCQVSWLSLR